MYNMYVISFFDEEGGWMYASVRPDERMSSTMGFTNDFYKAIIFGSIKEALEWWKHYGDDFNFAGIKDDPVVRKIVLKKKAKLVPIREEVETDADAYSGV